MNPWLRKLRKLVSGAGELGGLLTELPTEGHSLHKLPLALLGLCRQGSISADMRRKVGTHLPVRPPPQVLRRLSSDTGA